MPSRGRPRLTQAEYKMRLDAYCRRYDVTATVAGIPPFPSGRRETGQHREWLALYKAHARLDATARPGSPAPSDGACGVCGLPVGADGIAHRAGRLHPACHGIVALVEPLGPAGLDGLRAYLWPARSNRSARRQRKG
jgi:hypothetical protein